MRLIKFGEIDPVWLKLGAYLSIMFFIYLSDATLSDFIPGFLEQRLGSSLAMGLVMSTSSIAGILLDLMFAQLFRGTTVKKMVLIAIGGGMLFVTFLLGVTFWPWILLMILSMAMWGLYYEFFGFASQQYVSEIAAPQRRPSVWGILGVIRSLAYTLGPIVGTFLVIKGERNLLMFVFGILCFALIMFSVVRLSSKPVVVEIEELSLKKEFEHWIVLWKHVWPLLFMSLMVVILDSAFWTVGTIINDELGKIAAVGGLFVSVYMAPSMFVGFVINKLQIYEHKKRLAQILMFFGGVALALLPLYHNVYWYLAVVALFSTLTAMSWPLIDATYTDLVVRMGRERKHMIGLCSSVNSLGYIFGPILAGWLSGIVGNFQTFFYYGIGLAAFSLILLIITPRKLKLPQQEIQAWK